MKRAPTHRYRVVDVFTTTPLEGNPLAVFPDAGGLDAATMQRIARELNLAETAFVVPSSRKGCVAGVRIFTPRKEMEFAGHPTVGTSFVLLDEGVVSKGSAEFVLDERVGPVPIRVEAGERPMIWLRTPPIRAGRHYEPALCAQVLGLDRRQLLDIPPQLLSAGNPTLLIAVHDQQAVDRAGLDLPGVRELMGTDTEPICVFVFTPTAKGAYSRMFAPEYGVPEDPATGSSTGPLAEFMMRHGLVANADGTRFVSEQGTKMGRRSLLHVRIHGEGGADGIDVGGFVTPLVEATMTLPA
jgi:trans-2,3-dihydro-3-hydroxyanthranilate isomerase